MATDPLTLLAQANCYACFGVGGTWDVLELSLLAQWATQSAALPNLIPPGTSYNGGGLFTFSGVIGATYRWTPGANDIRVVEGASGTNCTSTCTFTAQSTTITLFGTPSALITATLVRLS